MSTIIIIILKLIIDAILVVIIAALISQISYLRWLIWILVFVSYFILIMVVSLIFTVVRRQSLLFITCSWGCFILSIVPAVRGWCIINWFMYWLLLTISSFVSHVQILIILFFLWYDIALLLWLIIIVLEIASINR